MGLSETEREHLRCILQQYEEDPRVLEMDNYIQHGCVTTYQHCWNVAPCCTIFTSTTGTVKAASSIAAGCAPCSRCTASSIRCWPVKMPNAALP